MSILLGIFVSLLMFSIIVLVHEFWHFKSARFFGVKVEEFGLWIPPRAKKLWKDKKWTLYSLNWLPLWGFVRLKGENMLWFKIYDSKWTHLSLAEIEVSIKNKHPLFDKNGKKISERDIQSILWDIEEMKKKDNLFNAPYYAQSIIILWWVFMNFLLSTLIFSVLFFIWVQPIWINDKIETSLDIKIIPTLEQALKDGLLIENKWLKLYPLEWSIAEKQGIKENDTVLSINKQEVITPDDFINTLKNTTENQLSLEILRDNQILDIVIELDDTKKIGSFVWRNIQLNQDFKYQYPLKDALIMWGKETFNQSLLTLKALSGLINKIIFPETKIERQEAIQSISWPIWVVDIVNKSLWWWIIIIIILWAIISINLWVFNLLPIPALDGWRFVFILINWGASIVTWKKWLMLHIETYFHALFLLLLIALSVIIWYNDIVKLIG